MVDVLVMRWQLRPVIRYALYHAHPRICRHQLGRWVDYLWLEGGAIVRQLPQLMLCCHILWQLLMLLQILRLITTEHLFIGRWIRPRLLRSTLGMWARCATRWTCRLPRQWLLCNLTTTLWAMQGGRLHHRRMLASRCSILCKRDLRRSWLVPNDG